MKPFNKYFDHTLLAPDATEDDIRKLCSEAAEHDFCSVCVNSCHAALASELLKGTDVKVASVVGFPLGAMDTDAKLFEADCACRNGASEIDMVMNVGALKEGRHEYVCDDMAAVVATADQHGAIVKVIIETCLLTDEEKRKACELAMAAGAAFVKTSTGFSTGGAAADDVRLMRSAVGEKMQIKASGGIRDRAAAEAMIEAGADRIGASASVKIISE